MEWKDYSKGNNVVELLTLWLVIVTNREEPQVRALRDRIYISWWVPQEWQATEGHGLSLRSLGGIGVAIGTCPVESGMNCWVSFLFVGPWWKKKSSSNTWWKKHRTRKSAYRRIYDMVWSFVWKKASISIIWKKNQCSVLHTLCSRTSWYIFNN